MKEKIIRKAREMFFRYGFKDVTMDEIARGVGISKKTLYQHFPAKEALIEAAVDDLHQAVLRYIAALEERGLNPVEEFLAVRDIVRKVLQDIETAPAYQLERYYPDIADRMRARHMKIVIDWFSGNIERGKRAGLYRDDIDPELAGRFFFSGILGIHNPLLFPPERFSRWTLFDRFFHFFLVPLLTPAGKKQLQKIDRP